jgi:hypothetical protein
MTVAISEMTTAAATTPERAVATKQNGRLTGGRFVLPGPAISPANARRSDPVADMAGSFATGHAAESCLYLACPRVDDRIASQRPRMNSRRVPARVGIVCHPHVAPDMLLQDEDVPAPGRNHSRRRRGTREAQPIMREIQFGHDTAEHPYRRAATAKRVGTPGRAAADNPATIALYDGASNGNDRARFVDTRSPRVQRHSPARCLER